MATTKASTSQSLTAALPVVQGVVGKALLQRVESGRHPPMAWINFTGRHNQQKSNISDETVSHLWKIKVHSMFYVNLTITQFHLEYSTYRCRREALLITRTQDSTTQLCPAACGHK